ncbi:MAG TPA: hypothetical protein VF384_17255 [Planctomycetota bacterium]
MVGCLLSSVCLLGVLLTPQEPRGPTEEQRAAFALLDEFDPLDTSKLPFVRVVKAEGNWRKERDGFLEASEGRRFRVRYLELDHEVLEFTTEDFWRPGVAFEPADLRDAVASAIADAKDRREKNWSAPVIDLLLLARACARRGMYPEVDALWQELPGARTGAAAECCRLELGGFLARRLDLEFTNPRLTWADLMARHEKWLELFPNFYSHFQEAVRETRDSIAGLLESKKARDAARAGRQATPADLVFDLHDEFHLDAGPLVNAESVRPPEPAPTDGSRPVDRLLALDLAAVPSLIEALGDKSPTRCMIACSKGGLYVRSLGDLAELVLVEIAGPLPEPHCDDAPAAWRRWLERATVEGPRKQLEEGVARLDSKAIRVFLRRWPRDLDTVFAALKEAGPDKVNPWKFDALFESPGPRADDRVIAFCIAFARESTRWETRLHLAELLFKSGNSAGVALVLEEWQRLLARSELGYPGFDERRGIAFLVQTGDLAAWRAISESCTDPEVRQSLAAQFLGVPWQTMRSRARTTDRPEVESLVRGCLLHLLADDARYPAGVEFHHGGRSVALRDGTCADVAACVLAANWPREYAFDPAGTADVRQQQISAMRSAAPPPPPTAVPATVNAPDEIGAQWFLVALAALGMSASIVAAVRRRRGTPPCSGANAPAKATSPRSP